MQVSERNYKRIVVKIGSSLLCSDSGEPDTQVFGNIARQINLASGQKIEVVLVSSGAIAMGMHALGIKERPRELGRLQAAAAVGQNELMNAYRSFLGKGWLCAQILLTWDDFTDRKRYLNAKQTLLALLEANKHRSRHVLPVINENDTISTEEIKFGDNDRLSALVATLINADLLIILSDVDGLLDGNKNTVPVVAEITSQTRELAQPTRKRACVGGMLAKIEAAKIAVDSGIPCIVANGKTKDIISSLINNYAQPGEWTLFLPRKGYLAARKRWIAFSSKPKGMIRVDDGAKAALKNRKSLLSVGVVAAEMDFAPGDIVSVRDKHGEEFARGRVRLSREQLDKVKGRRSDKEVIHRDNIVIL